MHSDLGRFVSQECVAAGCPVAVALSLLEGQAWSNMWEDWWDLEPAYLWAGLRPGVSSPCFRNGRC